MAYAFAPLAADGVVPFCRGGEKEEADDRPCRNWSHLCSLQRDRVV